MASLRAGCKTLYSEDLPDGQVVARQLRIRTVCVEPTDCSECQSTTPDPIAFPFILLFDRFLPAEFCKEFFDYRSRLFNNLRHFRKHCGWWSVPTSQYSFNLQV